MRFKTLFKKILTLTLFFSLLFPWFAFAGVGTTFENVVIENPILAGVPEAGSGWTPPPSGYSKHGDNGNDNDLLSCHGDGGGGATNLEDWAEDISEPEPGEPTTTTGETPWGDYRELVSVTTFWDFDDGTTLTTVTMDLVPHITHSYPLPGTYYPSAKLDILWQPYHYVTYTTTTTNADGSTSTDSYEVRVDDSQYHEYKEYQWKIRTEGKKVEKIPQEEVNIETQTNMVE